LFVKVEKSLKKKQTINTNGETVGDKEGVSMWKNEGGRGIQIEGLKVTGEEEHREFTLFHEKRWPIVE